MKKLIFLICIAYNICACTPSIITPEEKTIAFETCLADDMKFNLDNFDEDPESDVAVMKFGLQAVKLLCQSLQRQVTPTPKDRPIHGLKETASQARDALKAKIVEITKSCKSYQSSHGITTNDDLPDSYIEDNIPKINALLKQVEDLGKLEENNTEFKNWITSVRTNLTTQKNLLITIRYREEYWDKLFQRIAQYPRLVQNVDMVLNWLSCAYPKSTGKITSCAARYMQIRPDRILEK